MLSRDEYEARTAATRDARMTWWREARFGMFIHYGLYSQAGHGEWTQVRENFPVHEYERFADEFFPKPDAAYQWAALAKQAGMKYMVLTTRHHEGFSLWDSKVNPFNSVNHGAKRDIVQEYVDACRHFGLRIGFYFSLMDWHHPDSGRCAVDEDARARFLDYIEAMATELLTQYGQVDILWYDVALPMRTWEDWNSLERNQRLRALQPQLIINARSHLPEDFDTAEGHMNASERDWEACVRFNELAWGYMDSEQAKHYTMSAQQVLRQLQGCISDGGNFLLNIAPAPDGSVPEEMRKPIETIGRWLDVHGAAVYGRTRRRVVKGRQLYGTNGICRATAAGNHIYFWNWIMPPDGQMSFGGYLSPPKSVRFLTDGSPIDFEFKGHRIMLRNLPKTSPDPHAGIAVIDMEFDGIPEYTFASYYPQLHGGNDPAGDAKI
ncbi:MAG: alpha-L-fucosidase [Lentisphaerae bacterium]|jgi:alpha-L-fucosidase|nr:alpha-L-fucosidase [Lentisphaerota bacterium]MBT5609688.1 alpha-L-fucosidase [Lentisphaerota bacterium]MBT7054812.1 alpha-L-fucosidase [Lentisphaerota bacterium]MBT7840921.1 alpha-L-fucosidase [Lentisphaerota bacterium]